MSALHAWRRVAVHEWPERIEVRCARCDYRRDAFEAKGLDPDDDDCPLTDETLCRAINGGNRSVCRLPKGHGGDHREVFNGEWMNVADERGEGPFPNWPHGVPIMKEGA